ncbi:MAG: RNA polymerase sigma factor [Planctomycetota bacterium]|jgi:RNA polymerase sigma-70 factor (ECF subfamily)
MAMMDITEEHALVRRAKAGDGRAIEGLIRAHQQALYAFMLRMSGSPDAAEDIVQEAFVRVLRNLDRFDTRFRFSTWLFTIAKRLYVNAVQKHRPVYDTERLGTSPGRGLAPGSVSARDETNENVRSLLDAALESLNPRQREIILLFHQQGWPISLIADHLDMPQGTVKSHLHRARRRMKEFICADEILHLQATEAWA